MAPAQIKLMETESYDFSYFKAVALTGILDDTSIMKLREICLGMLRAERKDFILDMSSVIKVSRKVLELFTDVAHKLSLLGGKLLIMNMNPVVFERVRSMMDLDPNLGYFANEIEATQYIESQRKHYCF